MKTLNSFGSDTPLSSETILQQMGEGLSDLNPLSEAHCVQFYHALTDENQRKIDIKRQEMDDAMRDVMMNVHLILSIGHADDLLPGPPVSGVPQTIRALIHRRGNQE